MEPFRRMAGFTCRCGTRSRRWKQLEIEKDDCDFCLSWMRTIAVTGIGIRIYHLDGAHLWLMPSFSSSVGGYHFTVGCRGFPCRSLPLPLHHRSPLPPLTASTAHRAPATAPRPVLYYSVDGGMKLWNISQQLTKIKCRMQLDFRLAGFHVDIALLHVDGPLVSRFLCPFPTPFPTPFPSFDPYAFLYLYRTPVPCPFYFPFSVECGFTPRPVVPCIVASF